MTRKLLDYATHAFELAKPVEGGSKLGAHFAKAEAAARRRNPDAAADPQRVTECPDGAEHLWRWFLDMSTGLEVLGYTDILAWQTATGIELTAWESSLMRRLDIVRRNAR